MIEHGNNQPDFSPDLVWRTHRPALAHALGSKITAYYAAEQLQPTYGDGYMPNQKMIAGFGERACEVRQQRVAEIGEVADAPLLRGVTKATAVYEGIIDARNTLISRIHSPGRVMPPRHYGYDVFPFRANGFHAT